MSGLMQRSVLLPCLLLSFLFIHSASSLLAAISIDLGSEYMKIGLVKPGVPMEIVLNRESNRKTTSTISIRNGERAFGDPAAHMAVKFPKNTFRYVNELLGKKFDNSVVKTYQERFPFHTLVPDPVRGTVLLQSEDGEKHSAEELIAMLFSEAKAMSEKYAEQTVKDAVITVPAYFNQAERRAVAAAANIAGLNLLQLINDNTAAGINYGMFRRKEFNESSSIIMIFDIGATKTTATIFEYQLIRDKHSKELNPQMTVLGVGYDRTLGGRELTYRLRDRLAKEFMKQGKVKNDVTKNDRAMAKLFKEAERVKQVLSANVEHFAQIENVMDDVDFRSKITREEFDEMCADIFDRVTRPIESALKMAEMSLDQVPTVVLMGGGTRVPKIQEKLQAFLGQRELGKYLNTDEAIALGAVYQAAHLSKGFKVKKFLVKESNMFPIVVDFLKENATSPDAIVRRTLFSRRNAFPQRKVMTFSKHSNDFTFNVNYGDLSFLSQEQFEQFGSQNVTRVDLSGVGKALDAHRSNDTEFKGIKVHFHLDESGILSIANSEAVFERLVPEEKEEESTLQKLGNTISNFFGGGKKEKTEKEASVEDSTSEAEKSSDAKSTSDTMSEDGKSKKTEAPPTDSAKNQTEPDAKNATDSVAKPPPKPKSVREKVDMKIACTDLPNITDDAIASAKTKLKKFEDLEEAKRQHEKAHNALESHLIDMNYRLDSDAILLAVTTQEERETLRGDLAKAQEWLDEQGRETPTKDFEEKLRTLEKSSKDMFYRMDEHKERPRVIEALKSMLNYSNTILGGIKNLTEETQVFSETEISVLEKMINETEKFWKDKEDEQAKKKPHEKPAITIAAFAEKIGALDREVKYLLNKAKFTKPKVKKPTATNDTDFTSANKTESTSKPEKAADDAEGKAGETTKEEIPEAETPDEAAAREAEAKLEPEPETELNEDQPNAQSATPAEEAEDAARKSDDARKHEDL